jgi:hypothetical protein
MPNIDEVEENIYNIDSWMNAIRSKSGELDDVSKYGDWITNTKSIVDMDKESKTLDSMLTAAEELVNKGIFEKDDLSLMEDFARKRIRTNTLHGEVMSKLGITAVGNVNSAFFGAVQATKNYYGIAGTDFYNPVKTDILTNMATKIEQSSISSKKAEIKIGDDRVLSLNEILNNLKNQNRNNLDENKAYLKEWLTKNVGSDTVGIYETITNTMEDATLKQYTGIGKLDPTKDADKIMDLMINTTVDAYVDAYDPNKPMREMAMHYSAFGTGKANAESMRALNILRDTDGHMAQILSDVTGKPLTSITYGNKPGSGMADAVIKQGIEKSFDDIKAMNKASDVVSNIASNINLKGSGAGTALAMGVVGLAAGLIAAGYASGNPLDDANPETVAQEQTKPSLGFGPDAPQMAPNNTGGYIINIKGDTSKGNRQLKRAMKQAANNSVGGGVNINMNLRTSQGGGYSDRDIEQILSNYF